MSLSKSKWEDIILSSGDSYFFHSPLWAKIIEKTFNLADATRLFEVNEKEIVVPLMKKKRYGFNFFNSMPFGYGGFFSKSLISSDEIKTIIDKIIGGNNLIFNLTLPPLSNQPLNFLNSYIKEIENEWDYTHILKLNESFEFIWKNNFKKKTRNAIRKSEKNNIEVRKGDSLNDFKEFYYLYSKSSEKWGYEAPPEPFNLYKYLYKYGYPHVNLYIATKDSETIAGLISLNYGKNVYYWGSAFLDDYGTFNPTSLLLSRSIEQACTEGYKLFNMGASGELFGVMKFKEGFGAQLVNTNKFKASSSVGQFVINFLRYYNEH